MIENDNLKIKLTDTIDVKTLQKIQDSFTKATSMDALSKIRVVPKDSIEASAELLFIMANTLSTIGHQK